MKKIYTLFLLLTGTAFAQHYLPGNIEGLAVHKLLSEENSEAPSFTIAKTKNNSYDGPLSIAYYSVDGMGATHFEGKRDFNYTTGGRLTQIVTQNDALVNDQKFTYNFTWFGKTASVIVEAWNGSTWVFDYRVVSNYTAGQNLESRYYQSYNGSDWITYSASRYTYIGGEITPSSSVVETSADGVNWEPNFKIDYTYNGSKPALVTLNSWNDNYLYYVPYEKWEIISWGSTLFKADYLLESDWDLQLITDQQINKIDGFRIYPEHFKAHYNFSTLNWTYQDNIIHQGIFSNGKRMTHYVAEDNMGVIDTLDRYDYFYDPCFGYQGRLVYSKDMLGNWVLGNGTYFDGTTNPYGTSCYVSMYDRYENFSPSNPSGTHNYKWVITQASNLGIDDLNDSELSIYPNPTKDDLTVDFKNAIHKGNLSIYGLDGALVHTQSFDGQVLTINTSKLENGVYILGIQTTSGEVVKKFIKN